MMTLYDQMLPVIDLKSGHVVHGLGGCRARYRPIQSRLVDSSCPTEVASALLDVVGTCEIYVADLGAIEGCDPDWVSLDAIRQRGLGIWLDAGASDVFRLRQIVKRVFARAIIGLESLPSTESLASLVRPFSPKQIAFSLDLKHGVPLCQHPADRLRPIDELAGLAVEAGVRTLIILDLAAVGRESGGTTLKACQRIKSKHPRIELISGGGVRSMDDVRRYVDAGCDRVLVATSLHNGSIQRRA